MARDLATPKYHQRVVPGKHYEDSWNVNEAVMVFYDKDENDD